MTLQITHRFIFCSFLLIKSNFLIAQTDKGNIQLNLKLVAKGLTSPIGLASPFDGSHRLFIQEQQGKIRIVKNDILLPEPFLDLASKIGSLNAAYSEKGLLGLVFHPDYRINGRFFVYYSAKTTSKQLDHMSVIAEYHVSDTNPDKAATTERILMVVGEPESNHNGGQLAFGPDGYLYIGLGDGGGANDEHGTMGNSQNLNSLLGKILRIDVNGKQPFEIPPDNPFTGKDARPEIWAYGLRNPWRFSFDRISGRLFCGDVGQNKYEEVNTIEKGKNYGWRIMEASHCFNPETGCDQTNLTLPIYEYDHHTGVSVTGGYMYRGKLRPSWHGYYFFGDWTGKLFALHQSENNEWSDLNVWVGDKKSNVINCKINSFGTDEDGEIYIISQTLFGPKSPTGKIYRIY